MPEDNARHQVRLPPSLLSRKILCLAYVPAPFNQEDRLRFLALHALAAVRVIARHLKMGYRLIAIERVGRGYRIDLVFQSPLGKTRLTEVKSAKTIKQVHRVQTALYPHGSAEELVVSNGKTDEILSPLYIQEIRDRAQRTLELLTENPSLASSTFTPHEDTCYTCANTSCPFLARTEATCLLRRQMANPGSSES